MNNQEQKYFGACRLFAILIVCLSYFSTAEAQRAETTLQALKEQGFVRIAISNTPPFSEVQPNGKLSGAAPAVVENVFRRLGVKDVIPVVVEWGAMVPGLQAGRFDVIAAGLFINPQRCNVIAFSEPDLCAEDAIAYMKGGTIKFASLEEVAKNEKIRVGACGGCTQEKRALDAGVQRSRITTTKDPLSGLKLLQQGRIDALIYASIVLRHAMRQLDDNSIALLVPIPGTTAACAAVGFRTTDRQLRDAYDVALKDLKQSEEFSKLIEPFGFDARPSRASSREKLCSN